MKISVLEDKGFFKKDEMFPMKTVTLEFTFSPEVLQDNIAQLDERNVCELIGRNVYDALMKHYRERVG